MKKTIENILGNRWLELAARWFLGATFIYACYSKIIHPGQFAKIVYGYGLFPGFTVNLIAITVPWIELFAASALILGVYPRPAAVLINGLLFLYMIVIGVNIVRGHEFDCGCFSMAEHGEGGSSVQLLIRDIFYFAIGLWILFYNSERKLCLRRAGGFLTGKSTT